MIIVIKKCDENKFQASVSDSVLTYVSGYEKEFEQFRNGIVAEGETWSKAFENIKRQIDLYLNVYKRIMGDVPQFVLDGKANIITEDFIIDDFFK